MGGGTLLAGGGIGTLVIALVVMFLGGDPRQVLQQTQEPAPRNNPQANANDPERQFVAEVLASTEDTWPVIFREQVGREYRDPKLVLFTDVVQSGCGTAQSSVGPFYCPMDEKVYIDLGFYRDLKQRFKAPGDFAQAYVIAHEIGHHVQNQLGVSEQVQNAMERMSKAERNALSVRQELQADCYAGVWANRANQMKNILEPGDLEEALTAASAIGDDRLQEQSRGYVVPESFTHGSSEQRVHWFRAGFESGDMKQCDTFNSNSF